jgi:hypothetical protein
MSPHDDVVLQVGKAVQGLGTVCADLDHSYVGKHDFAPKFVLSEIPRETLSAFVPTKAIFTHRVVLTNPDWREPDLVVERDGFRYVLDIFDDNDTNTSVSRKVETVVANSARWNIVGIAMIAKGINKPYKGKVKEVMRLHETFQRLFGGPASGWKEDVNLGYLQALFEAGFFRKKYGGVLWDRVLQLNVVADTGWESRLSDHVQAALTSRQVMVSTD